MTKEVAINLLAEMAREETVDTRYVKQFQDAIWEGLQPEDGDPVVEALYDLAYDLEFAVFVDDPIMRTGPTYGGESRGVKLMRKALEAINQGSGAPR